jgi:hypothetical protein
LAFSARPQGEASVIIGGIEKRIRVTDVPQEYLAHEQTEEHSARDEQQLLLEITWTFHPDRATPAVGFAGESAGNRICVPAAPDSCSKT